MIAAIVAGASLGDGWWRFAKACKADTPEKANAAPSDKSAMLRYIGLRGYAYTARSRSARPPVTTVPATPRTPP